MGNKSATVVVTNNQRMCSTTYIGYSPTVRSTWRDIGQVFCLGVSMDQAEGEVHKHTEKPDGAIICSLDRTIFLASGFTVNIMTRG